MLPARSAIARWRVTVMCSALALVAAQALYAQFGSTPFVPFLAAVAVSAWYGGLWPGLLATCFGAAAVFYFLSSSFLLGIDAPIIAVNLASFLGLGLLVSILMARLHQAGGPPARPEWDAGQPATSMARPVKAKRRSKTQPETTQNGQSNDLATRAARRRLRLLTMVSGELATSREPESTLRCLAEHLVPSFADIWALDLLQADGSLRRLVAESDGSQAQVGRLGPRPPSDFELPDGLLRLVRQNAEAAGARPSGAGAARLLVVLVDAAGHDFLRANGLCCAVLTPLVARNRLIGAMLLGSRTAGSYGELDVLLAQELGASVAMALDNAALRRENLAAQARLRGAFDGTMDALLLVDPEGRYIDANPAAAALFGYSCEELLRMRVGDLPATGPAWSQADRERFVREGYWRGDMEIRRRDGTLLPVEVRITAILVPEGTVYLAALRDSSARRALEQLQRHLSAMLRGDLRRPLATLSGLVRQVQRLAYTDRAVGDVVLNSRDGLTPPAQDREAET